MRNKTRALPWLASSFVLFILAVLSMVGLNSTQARNDHERKSCEVALMLQLSTDKLIYGKSEPVQVTAILRNPTKSPVWISNEIGFATSAGAFILAAWDEKGQEIKGVPVYYDMAPPDFAHINLVEWVRTTRLLLMPGSFIGSTTTLHGVGFELPALGKYKLQSRYVDNDLRDLGVSEERLKQLHHKIPDPLWCGELHSNDIWIQVKP